jgi:hypothetical protein
MPGSPAPPSSWWLRWTRERGRRSQCGASAPFCRRWCAVLASGRRTAGFRASVTVASWAAVNAQFAGKNQQGRGLGLGGSGERRIESDDTGHRHACRSSRRNNPVGTRPGASSAFSGRSLQGRTAAFAADRWGWELRSRSGPSISVPFQHRAGAAAEFARVEQIVASRTILVFGIPSQPLWCIRHRSINAVAAMFGEIGRRAIYVLETPISRAVKTRR